MYKLVLYFCVIKSITARFMVPWVWLGRGGSTRLALPQPRWGDILPSHSLLVNLHRMGKGGGSPGNSGHSL